MKGPGLPDRGTRSTSCCLNLRDRLLRALQQLLDFLHINLRGRIVLMPHHFLDPYGIRIIEQGNGGRRVSRTMDHDARFLHSDQEQVFGQDPVDGAGAGVVTRRAEPVSSTLSRRRVRQDVTG